jgi:hypothetical protein
MMVLTEREKYDVTDADVVTGWMLQSATGAVMNDRKRELTWHKWE